MVFGRECGKGDVVDVHGESALQSFGRIEYNRSQALSSSNMGER